MSEPDIIALRIRAEEVEAITSGRRRTAILPLTSEVEPGTILVFSLDKEAVDTAVCSRKARARIDDELHLNGQPAPAEMVTAAVQDGGFESWEAMRAWFAESYGLPFEGILISWERRTP